MRRRRKSDTSCAIVILVVIAGFVFISAIAKYPILLLAGFLIVAVIFFIKRNSAKKELNENNIFSTDYTPSKKIEHSSQSLPPSKEELQIKESPNGIIINPNSNFELTLYNAPKDIIRKAKEILDDENIWDKETSLMPLFTQYNIRCREIDEYVEKYKSKYFENIETLKNNSEEYKNASEMDKIDMEEEFFEQAGNELYEIADCNIRLLFSADKIDITMDDELIKEYGFETISKYVYFANDIDRIYIDYERKEFEELLKINLAMSGNEIPINDILKQQPLKILNKIADGQNFKRKDKAIEYILNDDSLKDNIGKNISMRRIFKLKPLPEKFKNIDIKELSKSWAFVKEQIKLIVDTYKSSRSHTEEIKNDSDWVKGFRVKSSDGLGVNFICPRSKEVCEKKYSIENAPKLPLHIGCSCYLETITLYDESAKKEKKQ